MRTATPILALVFVFAAAPSALRGEERCCPCPEDAPETAKEAETRPAPAKPKELNFGLPVAGGPNADKAEPIEQNRDYRLDHHQKKGARDYFSLRLKGGSEVTLGLKVLDKGIDLSGKRPRETDKPYARIELQDPEGASAAAVSVDGEARSLKRASYRVVKPGRYVLSVGSDLGDMHKDQTVFKVSLVPVGLNCPEDEAEIPLSAAEPLKDCLGAVDEGDVFRFGARKRQVYRIEAAMPEGTLADLKMRLTYRTRTKKEKVVAEVGGSGGRVALESAKIPQNGDYFLEVSLARPLAETVPYALTLTKTSPR